MIKYVNYIKPPNPPVNVSVSFTSPVSTGDTVSLSATASQTGFTILYVEFYVNGGLVATDLTAGYSHSFTAGSAGSYSITAKAYSSSGDTNTSTANLTVLGIPQFTITLPTNGGTYSVMSGVNGYIGVPCSINITDTGGYTIAGAVYGYDAVNPDQLTAALFNGPNYNANFHTALSLSNAAQHLGVRVWRAGLLTNQFPTQPWRFRSSNTVTINSVNPYTHDFTTGSLS